MYRGKSVDMRFLSGARLFCLVPQNASILLASFFEGFSSSASSEF